jgi:hypothetical protein
MNRLRFTLAQLMAVVLILGLGFAALRNADELWAIAAYNLAVVSVATSFVGAIARKGRSRASWAGFTVFGFIYLFGQLPDWPHGGLGFGPIPRPVLFIEWGIAELQPYIKPLPAGGFDVNILETYEQISLSLGSILFGMIGSVAGRFVAAMDDRANG